MLPCDLHPPLGLGAHLTSRYGLRPGRTTGQIRQHAGLDIVSEPRVGAPWFALAPGTVILIAADQDRRGALNGYGNCVGVVHELSWEGHSPIYVLYAHGSEVSARVGQEVSAGIVLGRTGNTSNGKFRGMVPHLHFELRRPAPGGASPLPGPYARYNLDPEPFLAAGGITFGSGGMLQVRRSERGICIPRPSFAAMVDVVHPWRRLT